MVGIALDNWPEAHKDFHPEGVTRVDRLEHTRAWLLCEAKYRTIRGEKLRLESQMSRDELLLFAAALQVTSHAKHCFLKEHNGVLYIVEPKSMADITHEEFQPVFDEVMFLIERETGIKVEFIKAELRKLK